MRVGLVNRLGKHALPHPKIRVRKLQGFQRSIAGQPMRGFSIGPLQIALAKRFKKNLQCHGVVGLGDDGFPLAGDVEIHQRDLHAVQLQLLAQQPRIHLGLRPVKLAVVIGQFFDTAPVGFDLFKPLEFWVVAIGPAANLQVPITAADGHLPLVVRVAPRCDFGMACHALLGGGRRREAQVKVPLLGREFTQRAYSHGG